MVLLPDLSLALQLALFMVHDAAMGGPYKTVPLQLLYRQLRESEIREQERRGVFPGVEGEFEESGAREEARVGGRGV